MLFPVGRKPNEEGSILLVAMLMLVLLTLMGMSAVTTSNVEIRIASNEKAMARNFYLAEAAAMEAAQRIENTAEATLRARSDAWVNAGTVAMGDPGTTAWGDSNSAVSVIDNVTRYAAVDRGVAGGSSLVLSETNLHTYSVFGRYQGNFGESFIELGYKKRF